MHFIGIDTGAITTDGVLIDEDCNVIAELVRNTGSDMSAAALAARDGLLQAAPAGKAPVAATVATGYGRENSAFADRAVSEIICHARGARHLFRECSLVIDIGGQDTKVIALGPDGLPVDFAMNDKCAAGTGRFLEVMATALNVPLEQMGRRSLESAGGVRLGGTCTVFGESEVISLISKGVAVNDILAAIHRSVAERVAGMMHSLHVTTHLKHGNVVVTGGVARNKGVVSALEEILGTGVLVSDSPQTVGALGAALIARKERGE